MTQLPLRLDAGHLLTDVASIGIAAMGLTFVIISGASALPAGPVIAFIGVFLAAAIGWRGMHPVPLSGLLAGIAWIVFCLYTSAGNPLATVGVELDSIAAAIIGSALIQGPVGAHITFEGTLSGGGTKIVAGLLPLMFILPQRGFTVLGETRAMPVRARWP
jgi:ribose/xylose/arabinose/galactoside ABC-type transport system permease subunit